MRPTIVSTMNKMGKIAQMLTDKILPYPEVIATEIFLHIWESLEQIRFLHIIVLYYKKLYGSTIVWSRSEERKSDQQMSD